ncbi:hypothetical protein L873DRAFT_1805884 [Choiromyces venosus 120613-1]|uniref:Uncharacterized protein n=1 Tax=Choiromyces venosus 120613-1 TaxID=1336337 RepID=A0A3N4JP66_9PEZI|nr:hypothetical protein L873DRAFT_1805884 [Choiromyces venosus 120613-1]
MSTLTSSCFVDGCGCSQYLPLSGHPDTCVSCNHPYDVHSKDNTHKRNDDLQIILSSSSNPHKIL